MDGFQVYRAGFVQPHDADSRAGVAARTPFARPTLEVGASQSIFLLYRTVCLSCAQVGPPNKGTLQKVASIFWSRKTACESSFAAYFEMPISSMKDQNTAFLISPPPSVLAPRRRQVQRWRNIPRARNVGFRKRRARIRASGNAVAVVAGCRRHCGVAVDECWTPTSFFGATQLSPGARGECLLHGEDLPGAKQK